MPTENELRRLLSETNVRHTIDARSVIRLSRRRRLPAQLGAGALGVLAMAGIGVLAVPTMIHAPESATMSDQSAMTGGAPSGAESADIKRSPAELLNPCGAPVAHVAPGDSGLELEVDLPERVLEGTPSIQGSVRMTNVSDSRVTGTTAAVPAITVSQDGITVWHTNGAMIMSIVVVNLAPGESMEYPASIDLVRCDREDESGDGFRPDLPPLEAGEYAVTASIDFASEKPSPDGPALADLVTGPPAAIRISP